MNIINKVIVDNEIASSAGIADGVIIQNESKITSKGSVLLKTNKSSSDKGVFTLLLVRGEKDFDDDIYCWIFHINDKGGIIDKDGCIRTSMGDTYVWTDTGYLDSSLYKNKTILVGELPITYEDLNKDILKGIENISKMILDNKQKFDRNEKIKEKLK